MTTIYRKGAEHIHSGKQCPSKKQEHYDELDLDQISLFDTVTDADVLEELKNVEVSTMTPLDALNTLYRLQNKLKNRW